MDGQSIGNSVQRDVFDFEIGYLTKSPCCICTNKKNIPACYDNCQILDEIRTILTRGISSQASLYQT